MNVYVHSSALIKRVVVEKETADLLSFLDEHYQRGDLLATSSLGLAEVSRAVMGSTTSEIADDDLLDEAMSGIDERLMTADVFSVARRLDSGIRRTIDVLHLASAILIDADVVVTYDDRLAAACHNNFMAVASPGRG
jgi:predicted nucleic acid-binding protein